MVASSPRVLPKVPSLATFPVSSKTQNVCRRSPRSNPIVILFLLLAAVLLIRHRVYRHPQWRPPLPSHLISFLLAPRVSNPLKADWQKHVLASSGHLELGMFDAAALVLEEIAPEDNNRNEVLGARQPLHGGQEMGYGR